MTVSSLEAREESAKDRLARVAEYGKYRALGPIEFDGTRAFNPGDQVPTAHVEGGFRDVQKTKYDPETGVHVPLTKRDGGRDVPDTTREAFGPVVNREDVYEVGGKDDPNMDPEPPMKRPADSASLARWQEYAVAQGMDPVEASQITDKTHFSQNVYPVPSEG